MKRHTILIALPALLLYVVALESVAAGPVDDAGRPLIEKLGTIECDVVESTPVVLRGKFYRFEWMRVNAPENKLKKNYFRFIEADTGRITKPFGFGHTFGSVFVENDTVYVTGTGSGHRVEIFASSDLENWQQWNALDLEGWGIWNTSLCKAGDEYVLMLKSANPSGRPALLLPRVLPNHMT